MNEDMFLVHFFWIALAFVSGCTFGYVMGFISNSEKQLAEAKKKPDASAE